MYNHKEIENKWQTYWEKNKTFKIENDFSKPKYYTLDMFPYPSGAGLHVGHPEGMTANDIIARYKTANGYNVLHPMGWDAFGLPAENYAIKTGTHPRITTDTNINNFRKQLKSLGFSYDWDREVDTTDPKYYKWTQWIFLKLFENGLAYEQDLPINYCTSCETGLANEEVLNDFTCERCGTKVEKRKIRQWVLGITKYADRLLKDVDKLDWPEGIKDMQRNWIGKSEGCEFEMKKFVENRPLALILHGWRDNENDVNWHWMNWLKDNLESMGFEVALPILPNPTKPDLEKQLEFLKKYENRITEDSIIIGHSMGGFLAMHYVERLNKKINKLICVAPCFNGLINHIDISNWLGAEIGGKSMKINYNPEKIKKNSKKWQVFLSKNDNAILYPQAKEHFDSIGVSHIDIENAGHFSEGDGYKVFPALLEEITKSIKVYTTRIDTVFGMTYAVLAPDHKSVNDFITPEQKDACLKYIDKASKKSDQDRTQDDKEKTGVFTGSYVINPFNGKEVPLWIADYVLGNYGTGAVMAVPAHDIRDFEFAKKYNLEIIESIISKSGESSIKKSAYTEYGILIDSGDFSGLTTEDAKDEMAIFAEKNGFGTKKVNYKLRDWLFSRQRYWGEPIPLIHLEKAQLKELPHISDLSEATDNSLAYIRKREPEIDEDVCDNAMCQGKVRELIINGKVFSKIYDGIYGKIVCDYNLPLELPEVENFAPAGDGQSPLAKVDSFVNVKLANNLTGKRETNTMPQWGGSCWYYLRYMDPDNFEMLVNPEVEKYWGQVDSYVGGAEHAVLHLLYARFWHKFLFDIGVVSSDEPFYRLRNQGLILAHAFQRQNGGLLANDLVEEKGGKYYEIENGEEVSRIISKMSKSLKNVVNPDDIVEEYGADSLRLYEMYMAEFKDTAPWDSRGIIGVRRFIEKSERLFCAEAKISTEDDNNTMKLLHKTIKKVLEDIESYKFNTAISALMILVNNGLPKDSKLQTEWKNIFIRLLHPFTPHLSEELWKRIGNTESVFKSSWPKYDEKMIIDDTITIAVQVLGKVRGTIEINKNEDKDSVLEKAKTNSDILKWLEGKDLVKEIYVPGKIVNLVVK